MKKRLRRIYEVDRGAKKRQSHENEQVQELYRAHLGKPLGALSHRLLHRKYTDRKKSAAASRAAADLLRDHEKLEPV